MSNTNAQLLVQLLIQYAVKLQEIGALLRNAELEGRDVLDEEVDATSLKRDAALAKTQATIDQGT